jgi:pimeloyl-ACP methyl ester carboxylesterase
MVDIYMRPIILNHIVQYQSTALGRVFDALGAPDAAGDAACGWPWASATSASCRRHRRRQNLKVDLQHLSILSPAVRRDNSADFETQQEDESKQMNTISKQVWLFAVLAAVLGCQPRQQSPAEKAAEATISETNTSAAPSPQQIVEVNNDDGKKDAKGKYAEVNGLKMYYEVHGAGKPLVLLHGAFGVATVYPILSKNRQAIAVELQGHGHTSDIDRPLTFEHMADDVAALLKHLKIEQADIFGYSMGGNVALAMAIRHPNLVGKVAINGSNYGKIDEAYEPATFAQFKSIPADFAPSMLKDPYDKVAPDPKQWPALVAKVKKMGLEFKGFARDDMKSIKAPVLITLGDRDVVRPEHAVEMFRLIPNAQLAVFPGGDHFLLWTSPETVLTPVAAFLNRP